MLGTMLILSLHVVVVAAAPCVVVLPGIQGNICLALLLFELLLQKFALQDLQSELIIVFLNADKAVSRWWKTVEQDGNHVLLINWPLE